MFKKKLIITGLITLLLFTFQSCKKEKIDESVIPFLGGDSTQGEAQIDRWIHDTLTIPYNIQVKYKFDEFEASSINANLVPIKESIVVPALRDVKKVWIDTYEKVGGTTFTKTYIVKLINMVGSPSYNTDGSITLGEAEGGIKINLYDMNRYDPQNNHPLFLQKMHTIHHEFGHILQQNKYQSPDFQNICKGKYSQNWINISNEDANDLGFITAYASSKPDEDYVETISTLLVEGQEYYDAIIKKERNAGNEFAASALEQKEQMVITYYKDKWNIDFAALQAEVKKAIDAIIPPPPPTPLSELLGAGLSYKSLIIGSADLNTNLNGSFGSSLKSSVTQLQNLGVPFDSLYFTFTNIDTLLLRFRFHDQDGYYLADYRYKLNKNSAGEMSFGPVIIFPNRDGYNGGNANSFGSFLKPFTDFITNNSLIALWPNGKPDNSQNPQGELALVSDASSNIIGKLK